MEFSGSIRERVGSKIDGLSPQLRIAAEYVASHPDEIATRTLRQVAQTADLPPPTFSRLARALDCDSYEDLREICRLELKRRNRSLADKAEALMQLSTVSGSRGTSGFFMSQATSASTNIQRLVETIDVEQLRVAAETLAKARRVVLVGSASTLAMVNYFARMAQMAFDNWSVAGSDSGLWSTALARLEPGDAAFVMSLDPYTSMAVRATELARESGADVIAVTDGVQSPLAGAATQCFFVETDSPHFFPSHVAAMVLIEGLMGMIVRRGGASVANRIRSAEALRRQTGEYV